MRTVVPSVIVLFVGLTENQPDDRLQDSSAEQSRPAEQGAERAVPVAGVAETVRIHREQGKML